MNKLPMNKNTNPLVIEEEEKIEKVVDTKAIEQELQETPSSNYIKIHLESEGVFDAPKVLHFRDYTMEDALQLNTLDEEEQLEAIVRVLNNMVWEDIDCKNLHPKELAQIVYTLHAIFINQKIEKEYYYDEDLPEGSKEGQLDFKDNVGTIEIPVDKINTHNIHKNKDGSTKQEKFKEPFTIVDKTTKDAISIRLTRMYDLLFAKKYCDEKYAEDIKEFSPYKRKIMRLRAISNNEERNAELEKLIEEDYDSFKNYKDFLNEYNNEFAKVVQASVIVAINKKKCETFEEKLKLYKEVISQTFWQTYNNIVAEYDFGIDENVTFFSEKLQRNVTRRFLFQFPDFLPNYDKDYSRRYSVRFD